MTHIGKELKESKQNTTSGYIGDYAGHNIIFLDVDGVLNCYTTKDRVEGYTGIDNQKVKILKEIVDFMNADIVLSSSWKTEWYKDEKDYQDIFADTLDERLASQGLTIVDKTYDNGFRRGQGILNWIEKHGPVNSYIILDDEEFDFRRLGIANHWVQSDYFSPFGGLTEKHIEAIKNNPEVFRA